MPDSSDKRAHSLQITNVEKQELTDYKQARMIKTAELLKSWSDEERRAFGEFKQNLLGRLFNYLTTFLTHRKVDCLKAPN
jgi:DNA-binding MarR family transcriptional regulator